MKPPWYMKRFYARRIKFRIKRWWLRWQILKLILTAQIKIKWKRGFVRGIILASNRTKEEIIEKLALLDNAAEKYKAIVEEVRKAAKGAIDAMKRDVEKENDN